MPHFGASKAPNIRRHKQNCAQNIPNGQKKWGKTLKPIWVYHIIFPIFRCPYGSAGINQCSAACEGIGASAEVAARVVGVSRIDLDPLRLERCCDGKVAREQRPSPKWGLENFIRGIEVSWVAWNCSVVRLEHLSSKEWRDRNEGKVGFSMFVQTIMELVTIVYDPTNAQETDSNILLVRAYWPVTGAIFIKSPCYPNQLTQGVFDVFLICFGDQLTRGG